MKKLVFLLVFLSLNSQGSDQCPVNYTGEEGHELQCPDNGSYQVTVNKQPGRAFYGRVPLNTSDNQAFLNAINEKRAFAYVLKRKRGHGVSAVLRRNPGSATRDWVLTVGVPRNVNSGGYEFSITKALGVAPCDYKALGVGYIRDPFKAIAENALLAFLVKSSQATCTAMGDLNNSGRMGVVAEAIGYCINSANGRKPVGVNCGTGITLRINVSTTGQPQN